MFGLTQEAVANLMGTTKSAVSRLEAAGKHAPYLTTLKKYAQALGCRLQIKLTPNSRLTRRTTRTAKKLSQVSLLLMWIVCHLALNKVYLGLQPPPEHCKKIFHYLFPEWSL
ncbi:MAG: helix-turn-helix transcriptional regulator [Nitrospirae bacterium]|nr:helix-turn-helix transcriptional regulator [Nitrospirota bacterium]